MLHNVMKMAFIESQKKRTATTASTITWATRWEKYLNGNVFMCAVLSTQKETMQQQRERKKLLETMDTMGWTVALWTANCFKRNAHTTTKSDLLKKRPKKEGRKNGHNCIESHFTSDSEHRFFEYDGQFKNKVDAGGKKSAQWLVDHLSCTYSLKLNWITAQFK